ncbi:MAG: mevalonate kinase [Gammaproteobacteria bacterium GWE2_42_36]|nr:MAG: mevalonate kinase [Gammaproteobacteria bacterium GWE2_42_36]
MASASFSVSAPGSIMLLGEHAVLHGYPALVCAINRRLTVTLIPRPDNQIHLHSDRLGEYTCSRFQITPSPPFQFILASIKHFESQLSCGFDLSIQSEFSDKVGLGSSAAVTVATLAVLQRWLINTINPEIIYQLGYEVIQTVQGIGSGADIAASVFGSVLYYRRDPLEIKSSPFFPTISLVYVGYKTPTPVVVNHVLENAKKNPKKFNSLYHLIGTCAEAGALAIKQEHWQQLGEIFNQHYQLQCALGVSDAIIESIINKIQQSPSIQGCKISGSGLGDCVIALGKLNADDFNAPQQLINIEITATGLRDETPTHR